jgi:pimeloyl-ACP methyl ester carboxylesterase
MSLEGIAGDLLAVLDAVGSEQVAILANGASGLIDVVFAATYAQRTSSLVLDGCFARAAWAPDYSWGLPVEVLDSVLAPCGALAVHHLPASRRSRCRSPTGQSPG